VSAAADAPGTKRGVRPHRIFLGIDSATPRRIESRLIAQAGYELLVPKVMPPDEENGNSAIDPGYDGTLTIPRDDLEILNRQDYFNQPLGERQIDLLNLHFDAAIISYGPMILDQFVRFFRGKILLRPLGLAKGHAYTDLFQEELPVDFTSILENARNRFLFAQAFPGQSSAERGILANRAITLPLGPPEVGNPDSWTGTVPKLLFVCPFIKTSPYDMKVYQDFKKDFGAYPRVIAGEQLVEVEEDASVAGLVSRETLNDWMRTHRVMYYQSTDPKRLQYHPLEAIQTGMPLVFMKDSLLYELGGRDQPGACESVAEARAKVGRLLDGDLRLAAKISDRQRRILEKFSWEHCVPEWKRVIGERIFGGEVAHPSRRRRIAVFLPGAHGRRAVETAINHALMLKKGSELAGEGVDVVFSHVNGGDGWPRDFSRLTEQAISIRETTWRLIAREELRIANRYRGVEARLEAPTYTYPCDGASNFLDCDFWHVITDRMSAPLAPMRPYSLFVTDMPQRHHPALSEGASEAGRHGTTRHAAIVLCSMPLVRDNLVQGVGVPARKVVLFPVGFDPLPIPATSPGARTTSSHPYFIWATNASIHENHETALRGIQRYFERLDGRFDVVVTGLGTDEFNPGNEAANASEYVRRIRAQVARSEVLTQRVQWSGYLDHDEYAWALDGAQFLFHPTLMDAGTLSVAEASAFGVPALSHDYPPMRYYDQRFGLAMTFFDGTDEVDIARALKDAETNLAALRRRLPILADLTKFGVDGMAPALWNLVRQHVQ
jgi:glycosyltransferase involved in cell wall biosynthesis